MSLELANRCSELGSHAWQAPDLVGQVQCSRCGSYREQGEVVTVIRPDELGRAPMVHDALNAALTSRGVFEPGDRIAALLGAAWGQASRVGLSKTQFVQALQNLLNGRNGDFQIRQG